MLTYDAALVERVATAFSLRSPNKKALDKLVSLLSDPSSASELVVNLATGVGKTFLMAALVEYLSQQGIRDVLIVTPGRVVQAKTEQNFTVGSPRFIEGADYQPVVVTPSTYKAQAADLQDAQRVRIFIFNIQQLLSSREGVNLGTRKLQEDFGSSLYEHLQKLDSLHVIADEHHLYHSKAKAFSAAISELGAKHVVGLTATPDPEDRGKLVFEYTLGDAIADGFVKRPVIVYRPNGTSTEKLQLLDAIDVLKAKSAAYDLEAQARGRQVHPVLFVVASSIDHANDVGAMLATSEFFGSAEAVLVVTSESSQDDLESLEAVESADSPVRVIVSVNKLREGWDVSNIAVLVALRKLASQALTEQVMGRGLRLPFGTRTGRSLVDSLDIIAHDSYKALLAQKDLLAARTLPEAKSVAPAEVDQQGYAPAPENIADDAVEDAELEKWGVAEGLSTPGLLESVQRLDSIALVSDSSGAPLVEAMSVSSRLDKSDGESVVERVVPPNWTFSFPLPRVARDVVPFELVSIPDQVIDLAGRRHQASIESDEVRRTEVTSQRLQERMVIGTRDEENLQVTHKDVADRDDVIKSLREAVIDAAPELPRTPATIARVSKMVDRYLENAGPSEHWTKPWLERARQGLVSVIRAQTSEHRKSLKWSVDLEKLIVPNRNDVVLGDELQAHLGSVTPRRHEVVGGWYKHAMALAKFDAVATEFNIALILDLAPSIVHWLRLEPADGVFVQGGAGYVRYFPDFVALDSDGVLWLIEGKSDSDAQSAPVNAKKESANEWARRASDSELFSEEWRYMFATETSLKAAGGTWAGLKASADIGGS
ncbi:DEAD/DEAH box helicase [Curtobacterium sp. 20TX0008]|uniref:DEAD/DEAH box helicase n=1 Tax=Curtobacterium sp. 20TX0008 TaxID=3022018 RepID=UPI00232F48D6|nr:DEAD/DEAH box helicase family protein [Curtobacterium sp. 20TX0008]MDB6427307.1 DEAD/DEAH box helicase family protein [Curtobacterium sp. 20TX0008]